MGSKLDWKKIHMAMWVGLLINIAYSMVPVDIAELATFLNMPIESAEMEGQIKQTINIVRYGTLLFQCIGIVAFFVNPRTGLVISLCSSILTFDNSCVYILGAFFTYYRFRFGAFAERPEREEAAIISFASWRSSVLLKNSLFLLFGCLLLFWAVPNLLILFLVIIGMFVAFVMLILGIRLKLIPALIFYSSGLAILPHTMARSAFLPYKAIRSASVLAGSVIQFQVEMESGIYAIDLPLQNIRPDERKTVVAKIADTMQAKGIQLY